MKRIKPTKRLRKVKSMDLEITHRIRLLTCVIVAMFALIFIRLVYLQVFQYSSYTEKKDDYTSIKQYTSAPRGQIYDCKGRLLAATVVSHNVVYTSPQGMTSDDYLLYAKRIVSVFDVDSSDFSESDKKEAYITWKSTLDSDDDEYAANHLLSEKEREAYKNGDWGDNAETKRHQILMNRIGDEEIKEMSKKQLKIYVVYQRMIENASTGQENVILEDVSDDDVSYLVEHKSDLPGFDIDFGGWKREYPYGETLSDVLGSVSTSIEGLPEEKADYYLQRGYQYNAMVGKSGLELQYNDILAGTSEVSKITYDSNGLATQTVVRDAVKGNDVYLTIDIEMQQALDENVKDTLESYAGTEKRENFKSLFMCMMNPNDGSMLALSGYTIDLDTKKLTYYASGCYASLANPGSCIKGATVYMGESEGVVKPGEIINDYVMNIAGEEFGSYVNHGPVSDIQALAVSSNVYMFDIAIRMGGGTYVEGQPLAISDVSGTLDRMRTYYSMFGLGNKTGLDVPNEVDGYMGVGYAPGMLLNYSIGQMDMYTPLQLLQYVSVIAANGDMYKPSLMKYVKEVNSDENIEIGIGHLKSSLPKKNQTYLERVQAGFRQVVLQGNASDALEAMDVSVAGKTGTAEVNEWTTACFVGYAPYEEPEVAFACVAPTSSINDQSVSENICTEVVTPNALQKYFELYPVDSETTDSETDTQ